jgi:acetolactate synthase-1/2/3 large subunit
VLIDIPRDITSQMGEWVPEAPRKKDSAVHHPFSGFSAQNVRARRLMERENRQTFTGGDIAAAAELLRKARRPLLYAGGGVIISGAGGELQKLAERLNAPVAMSLMGIGAFPHDHRLCTGLIGMHGTAASNNAAQKADLLVAIGARFSDRVTSRVEKFAHAARVLHLDIDPAEVNKNIRSDAWVIGDVKIVLDRLLQELPQKMETEWNGEIETWKAMTPRDHHRKTALHPRFVFQETARRLGDGAVVVTDVGQHQIWAAQFYPFQRPRSFLTSGGLGTMGFGLGAALGAKSANPKRPVVLFTGDGSFRMNSAEMATLVKYQLPVLITIFNNRTLGMVRQWQNFFFEGRYSETDLDCRPPDFIKLGEAYGLLGRRAGDEASFVSALDDSLKEIRSGRSALIEAIIDTDERVLPMVPGGKPVDEQII